MSARNADSAAGPGVCSDNHCYGQHDDTDVQVLIEGMTMTVKLLAAGAVAVAAIGGTAGVVTSTGPVASQVQPVVFGVPLPLDPPPAADLPTAGDLSSLLTNLTNPGVSYHNKTGLVQGGISDADGRNADHQLRDAYRDGKFPLSFDVSNIQQAGPNAASAEVAITGPKYPAPLTQHLAFADQGGWTVQHDSALALMQAISAS
jgi:hypothetical protein